MSIDDHILARIEKEKEGYIFSLQDFADLGASSAVRVALHRMVKRGVIKRVIRGLYTMPQISKLLNKEVSPDLEAIAQAIADRDRARIIPSGSFALYALGLSTQLPMNLVYYTDGKARKITLDKRTITFKKTSLKKLSYKGEISRLVILALSEIGKGKIKDNEQKRLKELIKKEKMSDLRHDLRIAPQWIAEFMNESLST